MCPPPMGPCAAGPCGRSGPATIQPLAQVCPSSLPCPPAGSGPAWDAGRLSFQRWLVASFYSTNLTVPHTVPSPTQGTGDIDESDLGPRQWAGSGHITPQMPRAWQSSLSFYVSALHVSYILATPTPLVFSYLPVFPYSHPLPPAPPPGLSKFSLSFKI